MPNELFVRTRAGLAAMVSSRAADRILASALKVRGQNPDDVDGLQMQKALLGPVLHELEGVLPPEGLRRNLKLLAKSVLAEEASESDQPEGEESEGVNSADPTDPTSHPADASAATSDADEPTAPTPASIGPSLEADLPAPEVGSVAANLRELPREDLERHAALFAQIEHVQLVAAIRADRSVAVALGDALDPAVLARVGRLALALFGKGGRVKSVHLGHSAGELFLFPVGLDLLVVLGGSELNLGAVTTAFTALALEEDL